MYACIHIVRRLPLPFSISLDYLKTLHAAYEKFIAEIARIIPVIKVDYSRFRTAEEMATAIRMEYEQIANIRTVTWTGSRSPNAKTGAEEAAARKAQMAKMAKMAPPPSIEELLAGVSMDAPAAAAPAAAAAADTTVITGMVGSA